MDHTQTFNEAAFVQTYVDSNDYVADNNWFSQAGKNLSGRGYAANVDVDATIRNADIDVTLDAIVAGSPSLQSFTDIIRQYPDVKESLGRAIADEGQAGLESFQSLMTGEGNIDVSNLEQMMSNDMHRSLVVNMLDAVATEEHSMDYATRFIQSGIAATQEGASAEDRDAFMSVAAEAGIDPAAPYQQQAQDAFLGFLGEVFRGGDINSSMARLTDSLSSMGVSEEALQSLQNLLGPIAGMMQYLFQPYVDFGMKWGPSMGNGINGMVTDVQNVMQGMGEIGSVATEISPAQQDLNDTSAEANQPGYMQGDSDGSETPRQTANAETGMTENGVFNTAALGIVHETPEWVRSGPNNTNTAPATQQYAFG